MANLLDWNTLQNKLLTYIDPEAGVDTPQKAFPALMVATILGISEEDAWDSITDGSKDRGIDAVVVDDTTGMAVHLFQFKCVDKFENSRKNFPSSEIDKLTSYINEVLDKDKNLKKTCNSILWTKTQEIWDIIDSNSRVEFHLHFCGNQEEMVPEEKARIEAFGNKLRYFSVHHYSLDKIVKMFIDEKKVSINKSIKAVDKDYFDRTDGNARGLICTVEATEIVKMVRDPSSHDKVMEEIFDDNVRLYLSRKNKINKKIIDTALSDEKKALFWYLNNGITITCDSFSYSKPQRAPTIDLTNVQIVNGGQTTHALFEASLEQPDGLSDVLVLVRIIETRSESLSRAIAESTNSQTPINGRDLRSNDELQKKLEIGFDAVGYSYERKRNQWQNVEREKRVDALECAQAYIAYHLGIPEVAKKDRGRIFGDLYDSIYKEELSVQSLLCPYLLIRDIDKLKKEVQLAVRNDELGDPKKLFIIDGAFHVLYTISLICLKKKKDVNDYPAAKKFIKPAIKIVQDLVEEAIAKDETFSFNRFFKDSNTTKLIAMHLS